MERVDYAYESEREVMEVKVHAHKWKCSDIPAVFYCKCGSERFYNRDKQEYIIEGEGEGK